MFFKTITFYSKLITHVTMSQFKINKIHNKDDLKTYIDYLGEKIIYSSNIRIQSKGVEHIPKEEAVLFVCNHPSAFDIPAILLSVPYPVGFLAKEEIKKIPIVPKWMNLLGCVFINRSNPREALKSIHTSIEKVKEGQSLVVFPEGTRSLSETVGSFKTGALRIAKKTNCTIVPVVIENTHLILEKNKYFIKPHDIKVTFLPAIRGEEYEHKNEKDLSALLEHTIQEHLNTKK